MSSASAVDRANLADARLFTRRMKAGAAVVGTAVPAWKTAQSPLQSGVFASPG